MTEFLVAAAGQPWIYVVVLLCCIIDGFFPPLPSEAILVGLAALLLTPGGPNPWFLFLAAAAGAFVGDNIAYRLGRRVGTSRFAWMRRPLMQRGFARAGSALERRAVPMILVARFIPVARVAVNLTAGATGYSYKAFRWLAVLSASLWAGYSLAIGTLAGSWFQDNPLLGMTVAVVASTAIGVLVDSLVKAIQGIQRRKVGAETTEPAVVQSLDYASIDT